MAELIAVQCPHCGASLPPRPAAGTFACDYCATRFSPAQSPSARTQAGLQLDHAQLARMVAQAMAVQGTGGQATSVQVAEAGPRPRSKVGCLLVTVVLVAAIGGVVAGVIPGLQQAIGLFGGATPAATGSAPAAAAAAAAKEAKAKAKAQAKAEAKAARRKQRDAARKGLALADVATLAGDGWRDLAPAGMIGDLAAFDPLANLPWVMERARAWSPDARLVRVRIDRVDASGRVGLVGRDDVDYRLYSPARRASARALAQVSEDKVVTELRVLVTREGARIMQHAASSRPPRDDPAAQLACGLDRVMATLRAAGLPTRPRYRLDLRLAPDHGYRWVVGLDPPASGLPEVDASTCEAVGGRAGASAAGAPPDRAKYQSLKGCKCALEGAGGGGGAVQLAVRVLGGGTTITGAGVRRELSAAFALDVGAGPPWFLPVTEATAPGATLPGAVAIGVGCDRERFVVASLDRISAWHVGKRALAWSAPLGGRLAAQGGEAASDLTIGCQRLTVTGDAVTVPLATGVSGRWRLSDGAPIR